LATQEKGSTSIQLNNKLDNKAFYKSVFALVLPMALQNLINVGVQSADVVMLGLVGEEVLSASSLAGQVQFVMMLLFFGLASGASVLTAQYWGKGDVRTIEKVMAITLRMSMVVAVLFALAAFFLPQQLMRIFTNEDIVIYEGVKYLRIVAVSYIFMGFTNLYLMIMRSLEKVMLATAVYLVALVMNVVLNAVFIFGMLGAPAMGIEGAALATTLARVAELVIVAIYAARNQVVRLRLKDFLAKHTLLFRDFMRYGGPTILNELFWGLGIATNAVIIGHLGASVVAANSVTSVTRQLAMVVSFGVANAAAILIGKAIGGGDTPRAEAIGGKMMKLSAITGLCAAALILIIRPFVVMMMNLTPVAEDYLGYQLLLMSAYVFLQTMTTTMVVGIFRGGGGTRFGLILDVGALWGFSILFGALAAFVFNWPVKVVLLIILLDEVVKVPICLWRYRSRRWLNNVTR